MSDQPSLLDNDTLNASERELISIFERRATGSVDAADPFHPASAEEEVDSPITPGASTDPSAAPVPSTQGQVEGLEPNVDGTENAPSYTDTESETHTSGVEGEPPDGASASTSAFTFAGVDYAPEQLARAVQVAAWHEQLSNDQVVAIDALLSGQYRLVAANDPTPPNVAPSQQSGVPTPANSPASSAADTSITDDGAGEWLDPRAQAEITQLRAQLSNLQSSVQQSITPLVEQQINASTQQHIAAIDKATQTFATEYALSPEQTESVLSAATQAQVLPALLQRHNGDVAAATRAALDMMFWTTPSFRDPYVQQRTAADLANLTQQERDGKVKQQQMTALSASGGSVPRRDPKPTTKEDRHAAMVAEIAASQNGQ